MDGKGHRRWVLPHIDVVMRNDMTRIDDYLSTVEAPKREALERIRTLAKTIVPGAEDAIVYGMPTLTYQGKPLLGFAAHKNHLGLYPYSGEVIEMLRDELQGYGMSKGAIRLPLDKPIPEKLIARVIACQLELLADNT
jgi:uncharacterized protein YdhG (YjbR/CyaY superfamily)